MVPKRGQKINYYGRDIALKNRFPFLLAHPVDRKNVSTTLFCFSISKAQLKIVSVSRRRRLIPVEECPAVINEILFAGSCS